MTEKPALSEKKPERKIKNERAESAQADRKALRESEEKYQRLFNTVPAGIIIYDAETMELLDGNDAALNLYGYSREEFLKLTYLDITAEPEKSKETIPMVVSGEVTSVPLRYQKKKDGTIIAVEASVGSFQMNGRKVICGISTDISRYLQARRKLERTNQELRYEIQNRKQAERKLRERENELEIKTENLNEINAALKVLLKTRDEDKIEFEERVLYNVKELIMPYLAKLGKSGLEKKQKVLFEILESNLKDIISPFSRRMTSTFLRLTPKELQIANLVKQGKTSKDIAAIIGISSRTVETHRKNLRDKIGIGNKKANLRTYLLSIQ